MIISFIFHTISNIFIKLSKRTGKIKIVKSSNLKDSSLNLYKLIHNLNINILSLLKESWNAILTYEFQYDFSKYIWIYIHYS